MFVLNSGWSLISWWDGCHQILREIIHTSYHHLVFKFFLISWQNWNGFPCQEAIVDEYSFSLPGSPVSTTSNSYIKMILLRRYSDWVRECSVSYHKCNIWQIHKLIQSQRMMWWWRPPNNVDTNGMTLT